MRTRTDKQVVDRRWAMNRLMHDGFKCIRSLSPRCPSEWLATWIAEGRTQEEAEAYSRQLEREGCFGEEIKARRLAFDLAEGVVVRFRREESREKSPEQPVMEVMEAVS